MDPYLITRGRNQDEQEYLDSLIPTEVCEHCNASIDPDQAENVEGYTLCPDCAPSWRQQVEDDLRERAIQAAMNDLPADELMTLRWCLANTFTQIQDKRGCDNIHLWNNRITVALKR